MEVFTRKGANAFGCLMLVSAVALTAAAPMQAARADSSVPGVMKDDGGFFGRFIQAYKDEWYKLPPADPNAPCSHRPCPGDKSVFPPAPETAPPYPFTEWPMGGVSNIGASVPNAVDSPLMKALAPTDVGKALDAAHIQMYGWVNPGANISTSKSTSNGNFGNAPTAYSYRADRMELNQAVLYVERVPDTVQKDHVDWGFRASMIYGTDYRYTTGYGYSSWQLTKSNNDYGYDYPMMYGEVYVPYIAQGALFRVGRFIAIPDTEAQLAPNNFMFSHSLTYGFDNYTTTGGIATVQLTKNWAVQAGILVGTDTAPWQNLDRGRKPSGVAAISWASDTNYDRLYFIADGLNGGQYGYNNLQWFGMTYYHKFNEKWHLTFESYVEFEKGVPNILNPYYSGGPVAGDPATNSFVGLTNYGNFAACKQGTTLTCEAYYHTMLAYLNYRIDDFNNLSWRAEWVHDAQGQRTGTSYLGSGTIYRSIGMGWQHWMGPQIEWRPEIVYYNSSGAKAFGNYGGPGLIASQPGSACNSGGPACGQRDLTVVSADVIVHF